MLCFLRFLPSALPSFLLPCPPSNRLVGEATEKNKIASPNQRKSQSASASQTAALTGQHESPVRLPHRRCTVTNPPSGGLLACSPSTYVAGYTTYPYMHTTEVPAGPQTAHTHMAVYLHGVCASRARQFSFSHCQLRLMVGGVLQEESLASCMLTHSLYHSLYRTITPHFYRASPASTEVTLCNSRVAPACICFP